MTETQENIETQTPQVEGQTNTQNAETTNASTETAQAETTVNATSETNTENTTPQTTNTEATQANEQQVENAQPAKKSLQEILAENGHGEDYELLQQLKSNKQKEIEEKEKPFIETKEWAKIVEFSAQNKLATADDFLQHKSINAEKNEVLAFNKFKAEYQPSEYEQDLTPAELEEAIKESFNEKYFIGNDNETLKKAGEKEIEAIANEIRKPINDKILSAQNTFATTAMYQQHKTALEEFNKTAQTVSAVVKNADGQEETISFEITPELTQAEVDSFLKSEEGSPVLNEIFKAFVTNREHGDKGYGAILNFLHQQKSQAIIAQKSMQTAYEKGLEKAKDLSVGAKQPFNSKENSAQMVDTKDEPVRQYKSTKYS